MDEPPSTASSADRSAGTTELELAVLVEDRAWTAALPEVEALAARAAEAALAAKAGTGGPLELSVLLAGDAEVRALNARYRGQDKPTNVLSFPSGLEALPGEPRLLGDLALAFGTCAREAEAQGKTLADHLSHLVVHGTLHLLGYDHEDEEEAEAMEACERAVLARLGIADPYGCEAGEEAGEGGR